MPDVALADSAGQTAAPSVRTPLDHLDAIRIPGRLAVSAAPHAARLLLRGDPAALSAAYAIALPAAPCRAAETNAQAALWLGPDEWLLLAPPGTVKAAPVEGGAVTDVGHRQVGLVLEGPGAIEALATGCPLDLHPSAFPPGMCTRTVFGKAEIVLWRQGPARFRLEVWRSFAPYVHGLLRMAALDLAAEA